jgi:hypothetical protein
MAIIQRTSNEKMSNTRWGSNWRPSTSQLGLGLAGLGGLAYGGKKAYQVYENYQKVKDIAGAVNDSVTPLIQMIPL